MIRSVLRRLCRERGSVLPLVAVMMVVFLGMTSLAVDSGVLYQQQRQAQAAADAAALAGARDLPTTTTASTDAQTYAAANMPGATVPAPTFPTTSQIKVVVSKAVPTFFGNIFGISSANVSATAVASRSGASSCGTKGTTCYAIFARDSTCPGTSANGVSVTAGNINLTGGILSNSNFSDTAGNGTFGATTIGPSASGCSSTASGATFTSGPTNETSTINTWPIDYSTDFPACTSTCTGPGGTPSYCNASNATTTSWSIGPAASGVTTLTTGSIYCDVGSGTASTPSTWNGPMALTPNGARASFVGDSVTITSGGSSLTACGYAVAGYSAAGCTASGHAAAPSPVTNNYPLFYVTGASSTAINLSAGGSTFNGDMFAPNGGISVTAGSGTVNTFMEANDVTIGGGGFNGDGPSDTSGTTSLSGSVALIQ